ncbi:ATP-binding cassette domain-containing protein [Halobacillus naozhouensis]|uniref:ABC transporter ATP-binding protein n=1 Tax=Halobacillus naozhouensis TaxID=554880 RepID=A0ABY8IV69_9BACI|nr:ABC transporter ATP-binding protein [Halobacillus naozhouensis]WFT74070.1 ABC transporter ATP-binding protein [Halobacillus naozhouensis]
MISLHIEKKAFDSFELTDIPIDINRGEINLLLGHNGAGKTTIIKSMFGLLTFEGKVLMDGHDISFNSQEDVDFFKKRLAYIPDDISLLDYLTPREYFQLMKSSFGSEKNESFLQNLIDIFELEKYLNIPILNLSHGNQKKTQIVSQLLRKSEFIVFDEPTNGLDPDMIIILKKVLEKLKAQGVGILLSTHNLNFGQDLFDNAIILRDGEIKLNKRREDIQDIFGNITLEETYTKVNEEYYEYVEGLLNDMDSNSKRY